MKRKPLKFFRIIFTVLCFLLLFNCEHDDLKDWPRETGKVDTNTDRKYQVNLVSTSQIPIITKYLNSTTNKMFSEKDTVSGAIFDTDNIMEVIDNLNNTNYTFKFTYPDTPENVFYNLIISVNEQGELTTPYVYRYVCNKEHFEAFEESGYDFAQFTGTVSRYPYQIFFTSDELFYKDCTEHDQYGDPIACEQINVTSGSSGGGTTYTGNGASGDSVPGTGDGITYGGDTSGTSAFSGSGSDNGNSGSSADTNTASGATSDASTSSGNTNNNNTTETATPNSGATDSGNSGSTSGTNNVTCTETIEFYNCGTKENPVYCSIVTETCTDNSPMNKTTTVSCEECPTNNDGAVALNLTDMFDDQIFIDDTFE